MPEWGRRNKPNK